MKNLMKYISAATLMLAMASCESSDELNPSAYESDTNAVKINVTIAGMTPQTRVNTDGDGSVWTDIDMIMVKNTSNVVSGKNIAYYKYSVMDIKWLMMDANGDINTANPPYMVWADGENTFQAFYPYKKGTTNSFKEFTLPNNQKRQPSLESADWMTATTTTTKTADNKAINLTFKHELVKVTVNITKYNDQYPDPSALIKEQPQFTVPATPTPLKDGKTVTVEDANLPIDAFMPKSEMFIAVLMPGTYAVNDKFFQLTVDGKELTVNVPAESVLTYPGLEAGKAYTFNLTVGKNKVAIGNVTVNEWGQGESGSGGTAIEQAN